MLSALGGIVIATVGNVIHSLIVKKYEYKKDVKKFIFDVGLRQWKETCEYEKLRQGKGVQPPLVFVLFNSMLMNDIGKGDVSEKKLKAILKKHTQISQIISEYNAKREQTEASGLDA